MPDEDKAKFWRVKRRLIAVIVLVFVICVIGAYMYYSKAEPLPTCTDGVRNQNELGTDCGGVCKLSCQNSYNPLIVKYARAVKVKANTYDLVGVIENSNLDKYPKEVSYTMTAYNSNGTKASEVKGVTFLSVAASVPVIVQNVISDAPINKVFLSIDNAVMYDKQDDKSSRVKVVSSSYDDNNKIMIVKVVNAGDIDVRNLSVRSIITDSLDSAVAAGQRNITLIAAGQEQEITMTWYESLGLPNLRTQVYIAADPYYNN